MSDHIHSLTVTLEDDMRDDDALSLIDAIGQLRHVLSVTSHVTDITVHMAQERARSDMFRRLFNVLEEWNANGA